ncbi:MAG: hypothetical protein AAFR52_04605 [Pseudomonadota bacterium]
MPHTQTFSNAALDAAMKKVHALYGARADFTGVDVGYRYRSGRRTGTVCVRIHVARKRPRAALGDDEAFPSCIDAVPLDVIQASYRPTRSTRCFDHQERFPVLSSGVSCGRVGDGTGTIGAIVIDKRSGRPAILSNWHVLAGASARRGDSILQPGGIDGGMPDHDEVARLERWVLGHEGDAAIALLGAGRDWRPVETGSGDAPGTAIARSSRHGEVLVKSGPRTGPVRARVDGRGLYRIAYEAAPGFVETRDIRGFKLVTVTDDTRGDTNSDAGISAPGDSGALWHDPASREAVGLHVACQADTGASARHAIACELPGVLDALDARLAGAEDRRRLDRVLGDVSKTWAAPRQGEAPVVPVDRPAARHHGRRDPRPGDAMPLPTGPVAVMPAAAGPLATLSDALPAAPDATGALTCLSVTAGKGVGKGVGRALRRDVLAAFNAAYGQLGRQYMSLTPVMRHRGSIVGWRRAFRSEIERPLQGEARYADWPGLAGPELSALFSWTFDATYAATVSSMGTALGIDPWED